MLYEISTLDEVFCLAYNDLKLLRLFGLHKGTRKMYPAVFLDRDGTLIEDNGCISKTSEVVFYKQTVEALKLLCMKYKLFIVTNQSWISKGNVSLEEVSKVNYFIKEQFIKEGIEFQADYICSHQKSENCLCRKPNTFFAKKAAKDFNIDLSRSYTVGDHLHDVEFGRAFGGNGILVLTGHGRHEVTSLTNDAPVASDILEAANMILEEM